ncbi:MAG: L-seryl-tRNA(Sec) selenium transferase, partial [Pyrinomonadaceae bacterium]
MKNPDTAVRLSFLRDLPSVDELLRTVTANRLAAESGIRYVTGLARIVIDRIRNELRDSAKNLPGPASAQDLLAEAERLLDAQFLLDKFSRTRRVINATGVVIHTNLGRAPLSRGAKNAMIDAAGYATVEYDLSSGSRGKRGG